jgi:hypothetical protein
VPIAAENVDSLYATELYDYCYEWRDGGVAVALGCGSLYNHDPNPNATFERHTDTDTLVVYAARDITAGEEIFIDYTGGGLNPLWFEPLPV